MSIPEPPFRVVAGVKCYHPEVCEEHGAYPSEGFAVTDELEEDSFWVSSRTRLLKREILRLTRGRERMRLLEIGCGTGMFLRCLAGEPNLELLGSEIYLRGLRSAMARESGIEFIQLDASRIPFVEAFDLIAAFDVLEHIEDDRAALGGILRALKPGGHAVITVPQHPFLWSVLDELVHHQRRYRRADLLAKLREAGFELRYASSFLFTLFPLMLLSRLLDRGRGAQPQEPDALDRRVRFPRWVNRVFDAVMRVDEALIGLRLSLPWGGTLLAVARRPGPRP